MPSDFLVLGSLLLIGLIADEIGQLTRLPRAPSMIVFGVAAGGWGQLHSSAIISQ